MFLWKLGLLSFYLEVSILLWNESMPYFHFYGVRARLYIMLDSKNFHVMYKINYHVTGTFGVMQYLGVSRYQISKSISHIAFKK
jgi:hypothetical protein